MRRGFSLLELVVALTILLILTVALLPAVMNRIRTGNAAAIAQDLTTVQLAVSNFRGDVRRYPRRLRHLVEPVVAGDRDICGDSIYPAFRARWDGPYLDRPLVATGIQAGEAIVVDSLVRSPASGPGAMGELIVRVTGVPLAMANEIEAYFDGDSSFTTGTIRWSGDSLRYHTHIRGC